MKHKTPKRRQNSWQLTIQYFKEICGETIRKGLIVSPWVYRNIPIVLIGMEIKRRGGLGLYKYSNSIDGNGNKKKRSID